MYNCRVKVKVAVISVRRLKVLIDLGNQFFMISLYRIAGQKFSGAIQVFCPY